MIVSKITQREELMAAALLHDTVEDTPVTLDEIRREFGEKVASLVDAESEDKTKTWLERKQATIDRLANADWEEKVLALADKLSNMRSTDADYLNQGERLWSRFRVTDKSLHGWYYKSLREQLSDLMEYPAYQEFSQLIDKIFP